MTPFNCKGRDYCQFKAVLVNDEAQVEVCTKCGRKVIYNKDETGRMDNTQYLKDHIRDFCQPFGATREEYIHIYGHEAQQRSVRLKAEHARKTEEAERQIADGKLDALEDLRIWKRLSARGLSEAEITQQLYQSGGNSG
jgi:hypothetical protein